MIGQCATLFTPTLIFLGLITALFSAAAFCMGRAFELRRIRLGYYWAEDDDDSDGEAA